ncbi:hypothetical protein EPI10_003399 [Gossypium australe]|uniref:Reverse transcriptase n=1 Tax=Gossypium australe TaxID=47621 RepID=A0A5B6UID6_9ROSI|nr:hypothetical protein EPI10_003399 [Gossypium australe]
MLQSTQSLKEAVRGEDVVEVGYLNSGKHSAMVFFENKETPSMNSPLGPMGFLDSGKEMKSKGRSNKQNKRFHESNVRFKNVGSHRVSLKKSMENIVESILSISKENFGNGLFIRNDEQIEGMKRKLLWEGLKSVSPTQYIHWLVTILSSEDKRSPSNLGKRCELFGNFVDSCALQDLGFCGPSFTWQ